ncbi:hypothetical protein LTS18_015033 [Coniosporium uncinatum]|uniref:Uncharacterized protein n=1 Tax=Coniosporium uncinatum TaxID=93489 RepID=A0ACC3DVL5_9PEZI|nr:hypothetical protein LTS18_015033 [Coniosporium uncinatum]
MAEEDKTTEAKALREQGNELYRDGDISEAFSRYIKACDLTPTDPILLSNVSAAVFELGEYELAEKTGLRALILLQGNEEDDIRKRRLLVRVAKCQLHLRKLNGSIKTIERLDPSHEKTMLQTSLSRLKTAKEKFASKHVAMSEIVLRLPRYKPTLSDNHEFFAVGQDIAHSQFDEKLASSSADILGIMFAGVGDARHMYATITATAAHEDKSESGSTRRYFMTALDIKAAIIARGLIFLFLLRELSSTSAAQPRVLCTIFYLYIAPIVPEAVYVHLQEIIDSISSALEDTGAMPDWIKIRACDTKPILSVLKYWRYMAGNLYPTSEVHNHAALKRGREREFGHPDGNKDERARFLSTGLLLPPHEYLERCEPALKPLLEKPMASEHERSQLSKYLDENWKPNVTLIDIEEQSGRKDDFLGVTHVYLPCLAFDPFALEKCFYEGQPQPGGTKPLFEHIAPFFSSVAQALDRLSDRLTIEFIHGEMVEVVEGIRYKVLNDRPANAPILYDRIHMSNIPDYVGGLLTAFTCVLPLTKADKGAYVTSNCLRNPDKFEDLSTFTNEYLLTDEPEPVMPNGKPFLPMMDYQEWQLLHGGERWAYPLLHPRRKTEQWLYRHFFKLVLSYPRPRGGLSLMYAPLNVIMFFRLLAKLHHLGYPAHWLSEALASILQDDVRTTGRPPRSSPVTFAETKSEFPERKLSTAPFVAEMTTLAALWLQALPFGIISDQIPDVRTVHCYHMGFEGIDLQPGRLPVIVLVFTAPDLDVPNLRKLLLSDEKGAKGHDAARARAGEINVVTTFQWLADRGVAEFWMREDVVNTMEAKGWTATL